LLHDYLPFVVPVFPNINNALPLVKCIVSLEKKSVDSYCIWVGISWTSYFNKYGNADDAGTY
jgi:hypothetical protein